MVKRFVFLKIIVFVEKVVKTVWCWTWVGCKFIFYRETYSIFGDKLMGVINVYMSENGHTPKIYRKSSLNHLRIPVPKKIFTLWRVILKWCQFSVIHGVFWSLCPTVMLKNGHQHLKLVTQILCLQHPSPTLLWPILGTYDYRFLIRWHRKNLERALNHSNLRYGFARNIRFVNDVICLHLDE